MQHRYAQFHFVSIIDFSLKNQAISKPSVFLEDHIECALGNYFERFIIVLLSATQLHGLKKINSRTVYGLQNKSPSSSVSQYSTAFPLSALVATCLLSYRCSHVLDAQGFI